MPAALDEQNIYIWSFTTSADADSKSIFASNDADKNQLVDSIDWIHQM